LAAVLFVKRMSEVTNVRSMTGDADDLDDRYATDRNAAHLRDVPKGVEIYEISGPFFFGAAEEFKERLGQVAGRPKVLIIRMRDVPAIDSTGLHALRDVVHRTRRDGTLLLLSDVHSQPLVAMMRAGMLDEVGEDNVFGNLDDALNRAREQLGLPARARLAGAEPTVARESGEHKAVPR
ncbi:MAG: sodium-independent anion transporter, partial [Gemmatimonadetes bacterium]|nr:sodium-independent anion transporter [Gemmatimonadota bacterium]